jgi:oligopeptide/dipeptide ABC transporter ATP-binding protein
MEPILEIRNLAISFDTEEGEVPAVSDVSLQVSPGKTLGIVGETGCGKSVSCHAVLGLTPPNGRVLAGEILFEGVDLLRLKTSELEKIRGRDIAMIFQDPSSSLNPVHTIGRQLIESLVIHRGMDKATARAEALQLLDRVEIPEAKRRLTEYPHQLSGGMNQRAMIAIALACQPKLLIADEPTTALDVTIQAQILDLLSRLQKDLGMSMILITHDLGVIAEMAHDVSVMYMGRVVEASGVSGLFHQPTHPYTVGLLNSLPRVDQDVSLVPIEGTVPSPLEMPPGCAFAPRCPTAEAQCKRAAPPLEKHRNGQFAACYFPRGIS